MFQFALERPVHPRMSRVACICEPWLPRTASNKDTWPKLQALGKHDPQYGYGSFLWNARNVEYVAQTANAFGKYRPHIFVTTGVGKILGLNQVVKPLGVKA